MTELSLPQALAIVGRDDLVKTGSADEQYDFTDANATFVSVIRAHIKQANDAQQTKCMEHADFWGITNACDEALAKLAEATRAKQRPDSDYALVKQANEDTILRKYASYDANTTVHSAVQFVEDRSRYPLAWRKEAATKLLERAQRFDAALPEYVSEELHKSAGFGFPSEDAVADAMINRLNAAPRGYEDLTAKLAMLLDHMIDNENLCLDDDFTKQAMAALEQYDVETGLTARYGNDVCLPEDIISLTTDRLEKIAGAADTVQLANGQTLALTDVDDESLCAVDPGLAKVARDELAAILPTLPKADADLLTRLCR